MVPRCVLSQNNILFQQKSQQIEKNKDYKLQDPNPISQNNIYGKYTKMVKKKHPFMNKRAEKYCFCNQIISESGGKKN